MENRIEKCCEELTELMLFDRRKIIINSLMLEDIQIIYVLPFFEQFS